MKDKPEYRISGLVSNLKILINSKSIWFSGKVSDLFTLCYQSTLNTRQWQHENRFVGVFEVKKEKLKYCIPLFRDWSTLVSMHSLQSSWICCYRLWMAKFGDILCRYSSALSSWMRTVCVWRYFQVLPDMFDLVWVLKLVGFMDTIVSQKLMFCLCCVFTVTVLLEDSLLVRLPLTLPWSPDWWTHTVFQIPPN